MADVQGKGLKRKLSSKHQARKRAKPSVSSTQVKEAVGLEKLQWSTVVRPKESGFEFDDGITLLEEVEGVDVIYEDTPTGRVVRFNAPKGAVKKQPILEEDEEWVGFGTANDTGIETSPHDQVDVDAEQMSDDTAVTDEPVFDAASLLPSWLPYSLHPRLLHSLHSQKFTSPTPIQSRALPSALKGKDVIGVAETGSGKTLAYGLPILNYHLSAASSAPRKRKRQVKTLILAPTRELAIQVADHLKACISNNSVAGQPDSEVVDKVAGGKQKVEGKSSIPRLPPVSIATIIGGMSAQKQRRVLERGVDVLVATPGRLWDLMSESDSLALQIKNLKFLVLDEADRMIEMGHFTELDNIIRLTLRLPDNLDEDPTIPVADIERNLEENGITTTGRNENDGDPRPTVLLNEDQLQTFVFSATLSKDLQRNLKKRTSSSYKKTKNKSTTLDDLLMLLDFRDSEPEVIDLSPEGGVVTSLKESQIECISGDKDVYLYYFLLRYPGRTLVFLSSIDGIRRLLPLMELLQLKAFPLHSQLQQRQRLKNLDRFKLSENAVLLATDVAARGLDIPNVDHVIHYQIPRSADVYIHRNGRTARAKREGFSLLMCAPDERRVVMAFLHGLKRQDVPDMPVDLNLLDKLKARVSLARRIDTTQHRIKKAKHESNWLKEAAEAMELAIDSDLEEEDVVMSKKKQKSVEVETARLKAELKQLLSQVLVPRGVSQRYITSGSVNIVQELLDSTHQHEGLVGFSKTRAGADLVHSSTEQTKRKASRKADKKDKNKSKGVDGIDEDDGDKEIDEHDIT